MLKRPHNKYIFILKHAATILIVGLLITIGTYAIISGHNVPLDPRAVDEGVYSITGQYLVTLPCGTTDHYDSTNPTVPEARGLPLNYNSYDPCDGYQILRDQFLLDLGFWTLVYGGLHVFFIVRKQHSSR